MKDIDFIQIINALLHDINELTNRIDYLEHELFKERQRRINFMEELIQLINEYKN